MKKENVLRKMEAFQLCLMSGGKVDDGGDGGKK